MDEPIKSVDLLPYEPRSKVKGRVPQSCVLCGVVFGRAGSWSKKDMTDFKFSEKIDLINPQLLYALYDRNCLDFACQECAELLLMQDDPFVYFVHDLYKR